MWTIHRQMRNLTKTHTKPSYFTKKGNTNMTFLYETYDYSLFQSRFRDYGRLGSFSSDGLKALYEHLLEMAEDTTYPIEVDVIALDCDFAEASENTILTENGFETIDELFDQTWAIRLHNGNILYQVF